MNFNKISHGYVVQTFNDAGEFISQKFVAGGEVEFETEDGDPINIQNMPLAGREYHPFDMTQNTVNKAKPKFFTFRQNNSYGKWIGPEFIIIEAYSAEQANTIAEECGIYFDGCRTGQDCPCCGDRWNSQYSDNEGTEVPEIYGEHYSNYKSYFQDKEICVVIHYLDGRIDNKNIS
jgi:hypothetical protein